MSELDILTSYTHDDCDQQKELRQMTKVNNIIYI